MFCSDAPDNSLVDIDQPPTRFNVDRIEPRDSNPKKLPRGNASQASSGRSYGWSIRDISRASPI
jgi:hypothetical protein